MSLDALLRERDPVRRALLLSALPAPAPPAEFATCIADARKVGVADRGLAYATCASRQSAALKAVTRLHPADQAWALSMVDQLMRDPGDPTVTHELAGRVTAQLEQQRQQRQSNRKAMRARKRQQRQDREDSEQRFALARFADYGR